MLRLSESNMYLSSFSDSTTDSVDTKEFWVNMPNLMSHLKKVAEQKPQATYYNVDMIKYQVLNIHWSMYLVDLTIVSIHPYISRLVFPCVSGVSRGDPVHSSEPGGELAR